MPQKAWRYPTEGYFGGEVTKTNRHFHMFDNFKGEISVDFYSHRKKLIIYYKINKCHTKYTAQQGTHMGTIRHWIWRWLSVLQVFPTWCEWLPEWSPPGCGWQLTKYLTDGFSSRWMHLAPPGCWCLCTPGYGWEAGDRWSFWLWGMRWGCVLLSHLTLELELQRQGLQPNLN